MFGECIPSHKSVVENLNQLANNILDTHRLLVENDPQVEFLLQLHRLQEGNYLIKLTMKTMLVLTL